jgi:hypothetical protein
MNEIWLLIFLIFLLVDIFFIVRICVRDARRRGKSPFPVTMLVLCSFPLGLVVWLLFRPDVQAGAVSRSSL